MLFDLDDDTQLLQSTVREFAQAEVAPVAGELDRTKSFPYGIVAKMKCCVVGCVRKVGGSSQAAEDGRGAPWMAGRQFGSGSSHELEGGLCQQLRDSENASRLAQITSGDDSCDGVNEVSKRD